MISRSSDPVSGITSSWSVWRMRSKNRATVRLAGTGGDRCSLDAADHARPLARPRLRRVLVRQLRLEAVGRLGQRRAVEAAVPLGDEPALARRVDLELDATHAAVALEADDGLGRRSEERRVGKECRSRGSPYHLK